ncbi:uncharacterized protein G2W53_019332 [Senna tora]|uniref:Uncharacterized protein n=1 Tax=Senna tora TaxID=362788 RepID=A0A834WP46_9FABA|nr:uncharacterized protein G2W53_019332 [Senna tora]
MCYAGLGFLGALGVLETVSALIGYKLDVDVLRIS